MTSKIDRLFGSKTRVALLSKLLMKPERSYYIRELASLLNIPYGMLYRELRNLISLGVVSEEKRGKVTMVSANRRLPYFDELRGLMAKTAGLADRLTEALSGLKRVHYALIYGSAATGELTERSDIDILMVGCVDEGELLKALARAEEELGREVNYILWSEQELTERVAGEHHLIEGIMSGPIIMIAGDENEFRRSAKKRDHKKSKT